MMGSEVIQGGGVCCSVSSTIPNGEDQNCSSTPCPVSATSGWHDIRRSGIVFASWSLVRSTRGFELLFMMHSTTLNRRFDMVQPWRSEEHTSELQSLRHLVCR